jgi:hypothetical protein
MHLLDFFITHLDTFLAQRIQLSLIGFIVLSLSFVPHSRPIVPLVMLFHFLLSFNPDNFVHFQFRSLSLSRPLPSQLSRSLAPELD